MGQRAAGKAPLWSLVGLVCVFLPGILIAIAGLPIWAWLAHRPVARDALAGINAAVVGVPGAALYDPIWVSAIGCGVALGCHSTLESSGATRMDSWRRSATVPAR